MLAVGRVPYSQREALDYLAFRWIFDSLKEPDCRDAPWHCPIITRNCPSKSCVTLPGVDFQIKVRKSMLTTPPGVFRIWRWRLAPNTLRPGISAVSAFGARVIYYPIESIDLGNAILSLHSLTIQLWIHPCFFGCRLYVVFFPSQVARAAINTITILETDSEIHLDSKADDF